MRNDDRPQIPAALEGARMVSCESSSGRPSSDSATAPAVFSAS